MFQKGPIDSSPGGGEVRRGPAVSSKKNSAQTGALVLHTGGYRDRKTFRLTNRSVVPSGRIEIGGGAVLKAIRKAPNFVWCINAQPPECNYLSIGDFCNLSMSNGLAVPVILSVPKDLTRSITRGDQLVRSFNCQSE